MKEPDRSPFWPDRIQKLADQLNNEKDEENE